MYKRNKGNTMYKYFRDYKRARNNKNNNARIYFKDRKDNHKVERFKRLLFYS